MKTGKFWLSLFVLGGAVEGAVKVRSARQGCFSKVMRWLFTGWIGYAVAHSSVQSGSYRRGPVYNISCSDPRWVPGTVCMYATSYETWYNAQGNFYTERCVHDRSIIVRIKFANAEMKHRWDIQLEGGRRDICKLKTDILNNSEIEGRYKCSVSLDTIAQIMQKFGIEGKVRYESQNDDRQCKKMEVGS